MEKAVQNESDEETARTGRTFAVPMLVAVAWGIIVCTGLITLWCYAQVPGFDAASPTLWPQESPIQPSRTQPSLLMFAHPKCPCTRATIRELERLVTRLEGKVETWVIFIKPSQCSDDWWRTDLQKSAAAIPGVRILCDQDGVEAKRFHAHTSGLALLYAPTGKLLFEGGITSSRGHEGDSEGLAAVEAIVLHRTARVTKTPVFGCALHSPEAFAAQEPQP